MVLKKKKKVKKPAKKRVVKKKATRSKTSSKKVIKRKKISFKKKAVKKLAPKKKLKKKLSKENIIGEITHYFPHVRAGVVKLKGPLVLGDTIKIKGHTTDLIQTVTSIQIDRENIPQAKKGDEIGIQVNSRVRKKDLVIKV